MLLMKIIITQKQAVINLLEKKGRDTRDKKTWRPISLLNVDVKVISKVLVQQIIKFFPKLIHTDQSAFVKNRYIGEPVRLFFYVLHYADIDNIEGILFGADIESAFDFLDHDFIFSVLEKSGFGESFIKWVKVLHSDIRSTVLNNGFASNYFTLTRGTRQGDPLAPYLFILVVEVIAHQIRNNVNIRG